MAWFAVPSHNHKHTLCQLRFLSILLMECTQEVSQQHLRSNGKKQNLSPFKFDPKVFDCEKHLPFIHLINAQDAA